MIMYAVLAIGVLSALASFFKWFNMPKTLEEKRLAQEAKDKARDEKRDDKARAKEARQKYLLEKRALKAAQRGADRARKQDAR
jgi:beta-lactam-binding protein with PASTA domain